MILTYWWCVAFVVIAGILNFIPNFGPLLEMIPAVLVAFVQGPTTAIILASMYLVIQVGESNFITSKVQQKLVNIPPALIISAQLLVSSFGGWARPCNTYNVNCNDISTGTFIKKQGSYYV